MNPMTTKHKTIDCEYKALDDEAGSFELYAATFDVVDRGGDLIEQGAFTNLAEFGEKGWVALNHQSSQLPVAIVEDATQDSHGLRIKGRFHSTPEAQACRVVVKERMGAGKVVSTSIGYVSVKESYERVEGKTIRHLEKLNVYEVSFVNLPMNPAAEVISAKGAAAPTPEEPMEKPETALEAFKRLLGLSTKKSVAISAANRDKLKAHGDAMEAGCKGMKDAHKAMDSAVKEYKAFVAEFEPSEDDSDEGEDDEPAGDVKPKEKAAPLPAPTPTPAPLFAPEPAA